MSKIDIEEPAIDERALPLLSKAPYNHEPIPTDAKFRKIRLLYLHKECCCGVDHSEVKEKEFISEAGACETCRTWAIDSIVAEVNAKDDSYRTFLQPPSFKKELSKDLQNIQRDVGCRLGQRGVVSAV